GKLLWQTGIAGCPRIERLLFSPDNKAFGITPFVEFDREEDTVDKVCLVSVASCQNWLANLISSQKIWETALGKGRLTGGHCLAFSPNNQVLAVGGGCLVLLNAATGKVLRELTPYDSEHRRRELGTREWDTLLAFTPDGRTLGEVKGDKVTL